MKRRLAAMLAVPALLFTAAACGSDDGNNGDTSGGVAEVSGKAGAKPEITIPKDTDPSEKTVVKTVTPGSGTAIKDSEFVRLDWTVEKWGDDQQLGGTWTDAATGDTPRRQAVEQIGKPSQQLPEKVLDAVKGQKPGSRILVQGTAGDLIGENLNTASGISADDVLIWVVDPVGGTAVDAKAEVKGEQAPPAAGMPEVEAKPQQAATITIPKGVKAPTTLKEQVLIKGDGKKVEAGQGLIAQYTGVKWEDGKKFDSSWDHGGATAFQIGTGSVVEGWDKGLVGKNVGDRVLLVIPPALAYGANPSSELAKNTLVFVVDILGTV